ncbi:response regulator receiver domain protein [Filifactor alocis ATCC 35896]|uniref:Stage 0 sporulation protein A homolog n=1 Tax=Filifactor alocis (strain ATCC 35896 / CCUG 47790 / D40 B5) TaxID=546269 RepID=D6GPS5_FILAD|nr:response regulator transcription factor [Filifactor alocis]EFE28778.1 response regulator receiver domain protein [Filifactor alocis ATCC 35896]
MKHILIVDDEKRIRDLIVMYLKKEGYEVTDFDNADKAYEFLQNNEVDLLVLDIMMRGMNGLDLCKKVRMTSEVPIIFVSARSEELDRILGLELGADDYLAKPFSVRELVVRIKNILRRTNAVVQKKEDNVLSVEDLKIFIEQRIVKVGEEEVALTTKEYEVLKYLVENKGYPLSRDKIIQNIWGYEYDGYDRNVDDTIKRLRKKLKDIESKVKIQTVWGYGYKVQEDE